MENQEHDESKVIETFDENGKSVKFELYSIIEFEEKEYALMIPLEAEEKDTMVIMRLVSDEDNYLFQTIEDDNEFDAVSEYISSLGNEEEEVK